jgi:multicomponent Na+:H+ antiporter subunit E
MSAPAEPHDTSPRRRPPVGIVGRVVVLVVVWVALWGSPTVGNVLSGLLAVGVIYLLFPSGPGRSAVEDEGRISLVGALRFLLFFAWALVVATWDVAVAVMRPRSKVAEAVVAVPLRTASPTIATMVANAITLTPGTMTIEVSDDDRPIVLYVHVLGLGDAESIRADGRRFEELAVGAFGSPRDRRRLADQQEGRSWTR